MPIFKKSNGKVFGVSLTKEEQRAMDEEINRQIAEKHREWTTHVDAMILWTLHTQFGFGKKRLREFYVEFTKQHLKLIDYYQCDGDDGGLCVYKLKGIGIDLDAWAKEIDKELKEQNDSSKMS